MRKAVLGWLFAAGCYEQPNTVGDVSAIESGNGMIEIRACIEVAGDSCAKSPTDITLEHGDTQMTLPYGGFIFASYGAAIDLGDRDVDVVLAHGSDQARIHLPPAFELTADRVALSRSSTLTLTWQRGSSPMAWELAFGCDNGAGEARGENVDDSAGSVEIDADEIYDRIGDSGLMGCHAATVQLSRIEPGTIDPGFGADRPTGVTRRHVRVELAR